MYGSGTVWISAVPDVVYAAVSDLPRMGEWSPEHVGGEWRDPERGPVVGAIYHGNNRNARGEWDTIATVSAADPPSVFEFRVAPPGEAGTTWRYEFRSSGAGTTVTEAFDWYWTPTPAAGFRGRVGRLPIDEATAAVRERQQHLQDQVDRTLATLKVVLEGRLTA